MKCFEVLARRYCALLGEDPDQIIEGLPAWRIALIDLEAAIDAIETFGLEARAPMADTDFDSSEWSEAGNQSSPSLPKEQSASSSNSADIIAFRRVA